MNILTSALNAITPVNKEIIPQTQALLDNLTKPPGSLGKLEELVKKIASVTNVAKPTKMKKTIINMAGDHGVVAEGVSAFPQEVTPQMVINFVKGGAAINVLSRQAGANLVFVDIGVAADLPILPEIINRKIAYGTANMCEGPAMTIEQAVKALETGIEIACDCIKEGTQLIGVGEMGIGNTTPSTAIIAAYSGKAIEELTGRGTGIDDKRLQIKIDAIKRALHKNKPDISNALDVLSKVGGYEIAGLAGVMIGSASKKVPIIIDGFISGAAAVIAVKLNPLIHEYLIASHLSSEPGHKAILEFLDLEPMIAMDMRLGEGTGAALAMMLVDAGMNVLSEMATFAEAGVSGAE